MTTSALSLLKQLMTWVEQTTAWRWVALAGGLGFGIASEYFANAAQLSLVLEFLALVVVSVFCGLWPVLAGAEIALALSWWLLVRRDRNSWPARVVTDVNRTLGHVEALGPVLILAMVVDSPGWIRFSAAAWTVAWGPKVLDRMVIAWYVLRGRAHPTPGAIQSGRRVPMYGVTVLGTCALLAFAPEQWRAMLPSALAILAGMALRLGVTYQGGRRGSGLVHRQWGKFNDIAATVVIILVLTYGAWTLTQINTDDQTRHRLTQAACEPRPAGEPVLATWLLADTQFHELRGRRSAANLPMVDAVVPVAVRPVALDLLSGVTLDHFARQYHDYAQMHPATKLTYAYLGDLADVGCTSELMRFDAHWRRFEAPQWSGGPGSLLGIASGNHDNTFEGNFHWHPDWSSACELPASTTEVGKRLDKPTADAHLRAFMERYGVADNWVPKEPIQHWAGLIEDKAALPMVSEMGMLPADSTSPARPVVGVFLDTGDAGLWQFGVAGSLGNLSAPQLAAVRDRVPSDAWIILFFHHPIDQIGRFGLGRLGELIAEWRSGPLGDRLLLAVSGHTHRSYWHPRSTAGDQQFPEFTVGSTTDPTQEVAILELRGTASNPDTFVTTVPAVHRPAMDCSDSGELTAAQCSELLASLIDRCPAVTQDDCRFRVNYSQSMTKRQRQLADNLFSCLGIPPGPDTLDPEVYTRLALANPMDRARLVCLSWASSLLQAKKSQGWLYLDALRCMQESSMTLGGFSVHLPHQGASAGPVRGLLSGPH